MGLAHSPRIVTSNIALYLDFANQKSYPGSGNTTIDLITGVLANSLNTVTISNGSARFYGNVGFNASIEVSHSSSYTNDILTISCWAKSNTTLWNTTGCILSKRPYVIIHPTQGTRQVAHYYYLNNVYRNSTGYVVTDITKWHQYTSTWDGTTINAYVDGVLVTQNSFAANTLSTSDTGPMYIGRDDGLERYLDGTVALVCIHTKALTPEEVLQNFNAQRSRFGV